MSKEEISLNTMSMHARTTGYGELQPLHWTALPICDTCLPNLSSWGQVTDMNKMFYNCTAFNKTSQVSADMVIWFH